MKLVMMRSNRVDFTTPENLIVKGSAFPHCSIPNALGYLQIGRPTIKSHLDRCKMAFKIRQAFLIDRNEIKNNKRLNITLVSKEEWLTVGRPAT